MALVTALAIWSTRRVGCAMISGRTIETQLLAKKNLSVIWQVRDLCTFDRSVIFATIHTPTGSRIFTMRMINSGRARIPFCWLFLFALVPCCCIYWVSSHPQSNSLRDLHKIPTLLVWVGSHEISTDWWQLVKRHQHRPVNLLEFLEVFQSLYTISQLLAKFAYFLLIEIWYGRNF